MNIEVCRQLLTLAGLFFEADDDDEDPKIIQTLNLNDAFYWACGDCEYVSDDELPELTRLFCSYGMPGMYYWVLEKRGETKVEFLDVNRFVEFVRQEENLRKTVTSSSDRAYKRISYWLGVE